MKYLKKIIKSDEQENFIINAIKMSEIQCSSINVTKNNNLTTATYNYYYDQNEEINLKFIIKNKYFVDQKCSVFQKAKFIYFDDIEIRNSKVMISGKRYTITDKNGNKLIFNDKKIKTYHKNIDGYERLYEIMIDKNHQTFNVLYGILRMMLIDINKFH